MGKLSKKEEDDGRNIRRKRRRRQMTILATVVGHILIGGVVSSKGQKVGLFMDNE
jgi:hypothetical protein